MSSTEKHKDVAGYNAKQDRCVWLCGGRHDDRSHSGLCVAEKVANPVSGTNRQYEWSGDTVPIFQSNQNFVTCGSSSDFSYNVPNAAEVTNVGPQTGGLAALQRVVAFERRNFGSTASFTSPGKHAPDGIYSFRGHPASTFPTYKCGLYNSWEPAAVVDARQKQCYGLPKIEGPGFWEVRGPAVPAYHPFGTNPATHDHNAFLLATSALTKFPAAWGWRDCDLSVGCERGAFCVSEDKNYGRWCANGMAPQLPKQYPDVKGLYKPRTLAFMTCDAELGMQPVYPSSTGGAVPPDLHRDGRRVALCLGGRWRFAKKVKETWGKPGLMEAGSVLENNPKYPPEHPAFEVDATTQTPNHESFGCVAKRCDSIASLPTFSFAYSTPGRIGAGQLLGANFYSNAVVSCVYGTVPQITDPMICHSYDYTGRSPDPTLPDHDKWPINTRKGAFKACHPFHARTCGSALSDETVICRRPNPMPDPSNYGGSKLPFWQCRGGYAYKLFESAAAKYFDAAAVCEEHKAELATFQSDEQVKFLKEEVLKDAVSPGEYWVGVKEAGRAPFPYMVEDPPHISTAVLAQQFTPGKPNGGVHAWETLENTCIYQVCPYIEVAKGGVEAANGVYGPEKGGRLQRHYINSRYLRGRGGALYSVEASARGRCGTHKIRGRHLENYGRLGGTIHRHQHGGQDPDLHRQRHGVGSRRGLHGSRGGVSVRQGVFVRRLSVRGGYQCWRG